MTRPRWAALTLLFAASVAGFAASSPSPSAGYISALHAIHPDIVHGDEGLAVARGEAVCAALARGEAPGVARFTSPMHPGGFGVEAERLILAAVREHLCP